MKPQRLKESLNNRSFWDRDSRLPVTCKTPQFLRPRVWRFWGDFWIAKVDVTSGADLSGSVFSQLLPAWNTCNKLFTAITHPLKISELCWAHVIICITQKQWIFVIFNISTGRKKTKIMVTTKSTPSAFQTSQFI